MSKSVRSGMAPEPPFQSCLDSGFDFSPPDDSEDANKKDWTREGEHPTLNQGAGINFEIGIGPLRDSYHTPPFKL